MARAASKYQAELRQGTHPGDAWNTASVDFVEAAKVLIGSLNVLRELIQCSYVRGIAEAYLHCPKHVKKIVRVAAS